MSVKMMGEVWECDLPTNQMVILLSMADHADHAGENVYPTVSLTAWKTGYSCSQVQRVVSLLVKNGILIKQERHGRAVKYRIDLSNVPRKQPYDREQFNQKQKEKRLSKALDKARSSKLPDQNSEGPRSLNLSDQITKDERSDQALPRSDLQYNHQEPSINQNTVAPTPLPLPPKTKTPTKSKPITATKIRVESPESVFFRAIDHEFFFDAGYTNSAVWGILNGRTKQGVAGIIKDECERQKLSRENLDYGALAAMVPKFRLWYDQQNGKKLSLRNPETFCNWWNGWRNTTNRISCPPRLFYDPNCPHRLDPNPCDEGWILRENEKGERTRDQCICQIRIRDGLKGNNW